MLSSVLHHMSDGGLPLSLLCVLAILIGRSQQRLALKLRSAKQTKQAAMAFL